MSFDKDTWQTPRYLFDWLEQRYGWIHIDGCASYENALTYHYIGEPPPKNYKWLDESSWKHGKKNSVAPDFLGDDLFKSLFYVRVEAGCTPLRIFVNPPYSNVTPFLKRAKELRDTGHMVIMLLNNDKSTRWYQECIYNVANEVIDITGGRVGFINPVTKQEIKGNSKGQMIVVFDPTIDDFVTRNVSLDLIKKYGSYGA